MNTMPEQCHADDCSFGELLTLGQRPRAPDDNRWPHMRMVPKTVAILVLGFVVIPFALAGFCIFHPDLFTASPTELRPAGLYSPGGGWTSHDACHSSFVTESRYRIGMSRNEVQKNFAFGARLIASDSRPHKDWRTTGSGQSGVAYHVLEFERGLGSGLVAACDIYDDGASRHVLFFDDAGILVGAQQLPSFICLSASVRSGNEAPSADAAGPLQFALVVPGRASAEFYP